MEAAGPDQGVAVVVGLRLIEAGKAVGVQRVDIVEIHLWNSVVVEVLETLPALGVGPRGPVKGVRGAGGIESETETTLVDDSRRDTPVGIDLQHAIVTGDHARRQIEDLGGIGGEIFPGKASPKQEFLGASEVLVAAHVELIGVAAGINTVLVVRRAVVGVSGGVADVRIGVELLQGVHGDGADVARRNAGAPAGSGVGIGESGKAGGVIF